MSAINRSRIKLPDTQSRRIKSCVSEPLQFIGSLTPSRNINATSSARPRLTSDTQHAQSGSTVTKRNGSRQLSGGKASRRAFKSPSNVPQLRSGFAVANVPTRVKEAFGQDIRFIDVPNTNFEQEATSVVELQTSAVELTASDILRRCDESDYRDVYEICLRATNLAKILHLEPFMKLRSLDLSGNQITIIENLNQNLELRELKLYDNKISQITNLERLKDLLHLHIQHNRIQSIGNGLRGLVKLKVLRLDFNRISRIEARELTSCSQLTSLDISNNCLVDISALASLPNLEELYARHNNLRKVNDLSRCKKLQEVDLSFNPLTDLSGLKDSSNIRMLCVSHCHLSSFSSLGNLKDLEELNASHCQLRTVKPLAQYYPSLQILDVSWNYLASGDNLNALKSMNELVELSVEGNPFCGDFCSRDEITSTVYSLLPQLQVLDSINLIRMLPQTQSRTVPVQPMTSQMRPMTPLMRPTTPLMGPEAPGNSRIVKSSASFAQRPVTPLTSRLASSCLKVDEKQMEEQLSEIQAQLNSFENEFSAKIQTLRASIKSLPSVVTSAAAQRNGSVQSSGSRPPSRCGVRSRLQDAKSFADRLQFEAQ